MQRVKDAVWRASEAIGFSPRRLGGRRRAALFDQLDRMRADNAAAPMPYQAGPIWEDLARRFHRWFAVGGIDAVEDHPMNQFFSSPEPGNPKLLRYACWLLYCDVVRRDHMRVLDRVSADGAHTFVFDGRRVSWDLLISLDTLYAIAEVEPRILTDVVVVGELGAGWGRLGYVLRQANPAARYVVFDLPEVLLVSQTHLPRRLPGASITGYDNAREGLLGRERLCSTGLTFLGAHDLERVEPSVIDIMVNVASFQEMSAAQVAAYFAVIDRVCSGILYTQQLWVAGTHGYGLGEVDGWNAYPWPATWTLALKRNATWSDLYFEAVHQVGASSRQPMVDQREPKVVR